VWEASLAVLVVEHKPIVEVVGSHRHAAIVGSTTLPSE